MIEVIVAGAGPAGALAATLLARAGVRVLLVDRARFPRQKLCGDTLNPGAVALLKRLGLADEAAKMALPIEGMMVTGEGGARIEGRYPGDERGWAIRRRELDYALVKAAAAAGAQVEEEVSVRGWLVDHEKKGPACRGLRLSRAGGRVLRVPAGVTIAADGRHSRIAFGLGLARHPRHPRRWAAGTYYEGVRHRPSFGEMHVRSTHYLGVAPLPDGLVNVCFVSADRQGFDHPGELIARAIASDPDLRRRFDGARQVSPVVSLGPLAVETRGSGLPGLLLAGDAAGFVDPMTGDGLRFALRGAELAAGAALEVIETGTRSAHAMLARRRQLEFRRKVRFNRSLRSLVGSRIGVGCASVAAAVMPKAFERLVRFAGDTA